MLLKPDKLHNLKLFLNYSLIAFLLALLLLPVLEARLSPAIIVFSLALLGGLVGLSRIRIILSISAWILALGYASFSLTPLAKELAPYFVEVDQLPQSADAIITLSAEAPFSNVVKAQALERLLHGKKLLQSGVANTIVLTDLHWYKGNPKEDRHFLLAEESSKMISVGPVENTYDEAKAVKKLAIERGWKKIILVTSPVHSRRAKAIFKEQLPDIEIFSAPSETRDFDLNLVITSYDKLKLSRLMVYEVGAWAKNYILGRL